MSAAEGLIQNALLGEAVDRGPALVFVADETMRYIAVNTRACEVLGYTRDELLALSVKDVAREPTSPHEYDQMLARGFRQGDAILTRKDGSTFPFTYRAEKVTVAGLALFVSIGFPVESA
jgi:PAS domain S-box-containing protein